MGLLTLAVLFLLFFLLTLSRVAVSAVHEAEASFQHRKDRP